MQSTFFRILDKRLREWGRSREERWFRKNTFIQGRYRILHQLGMGSYGVAYLCDDVRARRRCVLKRVRPVRGGRQRARFIYTQETEILSHLFHSCIPEMYERFRYRNQLCYTMEFISGKSLEQLLFHEQCEFTEKESLVLLKRLLAVIAYLHSVGIIHRDISISNVMLDGGTVRLIDFGLARKVSVGDASDEEGDTDSGDPLEKQLRRRLRVTSDFYALGHLLLFMLYSGFEENTDSAAAEERSWEEELTLDPGTKKLLRRLLMTEQPYSDAGQIDQDIDRILRHL